MTQQNGDGGKRCANCGGVGVARDAELCRVCEIERDEGPKAAPPLPAKAGEQGWSRQGQALELPRFQRFDYQARIRWLDPGQLTSYMAALRPAFRVQMQLLVGTGMRLGESEAIRVCDLQLGDGANRAMIEDSKTATGVRTVFVREWAAEALREHIHEHALSGQDRLFTIKRRSVQAEHNRACELVGIHDYTIHDHRHTAAVHLARAGMPLHLLQQQLGHKNIDMTMKYSRFHPDYSDVAGYFDRVGDRLGPRGRRDGRHPRTSPEGCRTSRRRPRGSGGSGGGFGCREG